MSPGGNGGSQPLANLVVQFVQQGQERLKQSFDDLQTALSAIVLSIQKMDNNMKTAMTAAKEKTKQATEQTSKLGEAFGKIGTTIQIALGAGIATIGNFVRQGLGASAMGQLFQIQMERLSLTIAGLFRPELEKVLNGISRFTTWIQNLTAAQKTSIAHWIQGAAAALAMGLVLPKVFSGVQMLIGGFRALQAAITGGLSATGIGALLPLIGLAVQGITAFLVSTESGRDMLSSMGEALSPIVDEFKSLWNLVATEMNDAMSDFADSLAGAARGMAALIKLTVQLWKATGGLERSILALKIALKSFEVSMAPFVLLNDLLGGKKGATKKKDENREMLNPRGGSFENIEATYRRIAQASVGVGSAGKSPEQRTADGIDYLNQTAKDIHSSVKNPRPEIAR